MKSLSSRLEAIAESATLAMAAKSRELQSQGIQVINLNLGEPDFKTPIHICTAAKQAIDDGRFFSYPPVAGYADLRQAIAQKYRQENKVPYEAENIVISNGAKQSIANALLSLFNPKDEIIVFAPYWVSYDALVRLSEATPVFVHGKKENDFKVTPAQIEKAITAKTRGLLFSSPCNPTGSVFSKTELANIAQLIKAHPHLLAITDEIYEHIVFTDKSVSLASFPGLFDQTITINGFAKGFAMTGWRVGYLAAPQWIASGCTKIQGQITSANCSIAQRAALAAITGNMTPTYDMVKEYKQRRDLVYPLLKQIPGCQVTQPQGAFYFFPDVSHYYGKHTKDGPIRNSHDLSLFLLETAHVAVVAGDAFGDDSCIRISYAASEEDLKEGIHRIQKALSSLS